MKITVLGAGGWGTALANLLSQSHEVSLWSYEQEVADEINSKATNSVYLPNIVLNPNLLASNDSRIADDAEVIVNTIPTQFIRQTVSKNNFNFSGKVFVNGSKGIEKGTLKLISEIFCEISPQNAANYVILSGPSHAEEVARKMPTAVVAASDDASLAKQIQEVFTTNDFRVYTSDDVVGVEIAGSLKNVIAIAAGIVDGLGMGDNTKAALITRGIAELQRLGVAVGARPWTFSGLSGLGDLFVTCNSRHSRNRKVGEMIGGGMSLEEIRSGMKMIAEGVETTHSALNLGRSHKVDLPITEQVYNILFENLPPKDAIRELMTRESKHEWGW